MLLMPDPDSARMDPFLDETTLILTCDVIEPSTGKGYDRDPRSIAKRAEAYLKSTGIGDTAYFGPEPEFFIFDAVTWNVDMSGCYVQDQVRRSAVVDRDDFEGGNMGHRPPVKGGYFPGAAGRFAAGHPLGDVPRARAEGRRSRSASPRSGGAGPVRDRHQVQDAGEARRLAADPEVHRAQRRARYGKTATFMPKPVVGDNGSGMHVHQSIWKGGTEPVRRQRLRGPVRVRALLHRRHHQARARR